MKVTVDAIVFGYKQNDLKILLVKRKYEPFQNQWSLPGGYVDENETFVDAVNRKLQEEAGIEHIFLEQLYTFDNPNRDPRGRTISISYYGLVSPQDTHVEKDATTLDAKWFSISKLNELQIAFDHKDIINTALTRLKGKIVYQPIGFELLPEKFTFPQLQSLYETILNIEIDKRNFKKKFLKLNILNETGEKSESTGAGRKAELYKFDEEKYHQKMKDGIYFELI